MNRNVHFNRALLATVLAALLACSTSSAWAGPEASVDAGKRVYQRWCVECHGPGVGFMGRPLTGTEALEAKYDGKLPAVLDERTDLTPTFVAYFVRHGVSLMPFFRKTEISDAELAALGAYLSRQTPAGPP